MSAVGTAVTPRPLKAKSLEKTLRQQKQSVEEPQMLTPLVIKVRVKDDKKTIFVAIPINPLI